MPGLNLFFHSVTVNSDDVLSLSCSVLILKSVLCLMLSFQGWERTFGITVPTSLTQSLRQELPSYHLQLSQILSQKGALKSEFPTVTLNSAICLPTHHAGFASLPFQKKKKKRGQFVPCILLRSKRHTIAYPPFCICSKYKGRPKKPKKLLNTTNYSENKSHILTMKVKKKNPSSSRTRGNGTNWVRSF